MLAGLFPLLAQHLGTVLPAAAPGVVVGGGV